MGCQISSNTIVPCDGFQTPDPATTKIFKPFDDKPVGDSSAKPDDGSKNNTALINLQKQLKLARYKARKASLISYSSVTSILPPKWPEKDSMCTLKGFSIDTSRAKSNLAVVSMCAQRLDMEEYPMGRSDGKNCNVYWHNVVYHDMKSVVKTADSCVNKFPGMTELAKKISLSQAIHSMQSLFPEQFRFYPKSWIIPAQLAEFQQHSKGLEDKSWFIVKPDEGAQGAGIYLINSPDQLKNTIDRHLIQEYVSDPFLLPDQLKFDFRVYAVIKSLNPLSIYVAREGMARFCTEKYEKPTGENFENLFAHLTNYSLNKSNNSYVHSHTLRDQLKGSKRLLSTVFHQMEARGVRTRRLWHEIKLIIVKTTLAMIPEVMLNYEHYFQGTPGPQCFQIMGFDIIVRKDCMPLLLEVNSAPSLTIEHSGFAESELTPVRSLVDELIKVPLVRDTLLLVLNKLDESNSARAFANADTISWESASINGHVLNQSVEDDLGMIRRKKKAHLSEIFPGRYGPHSKHLLFLDRAVYLFMQFINVKQSILITMGSLKSFIRKCNLSDVITNEELEKKFNQIYFYFTSKVTVPSSGLQFHGFLQLLFHIAKLKFPEVPSLVEALQSLLAFCDASLRHYGVRSTRLRRAEIEMDQNANNNNNSVEIYLLPNRMRQSKASATSTRSHFKSAAYMRRSAIRNSRSVPRMQPQTQTIKTLPGTNTTYPLADGTPPTHINGTATSLPRISVHN